MNETIMVTRSSMPPYEEYIEEIKDIWDSHWLTNMGVKHKQFQAMLKDYMKVEQVELLTNGHMAIELSLQALGLTEGEVITTPYTFASTTHAIVRNGLTPVFCDIDPITFTMDVDQIEGLITDKTVAILPVHVYGNVCNVDVIADIAARHHLKLIYDAAHTFGETYKGRGIGDYGDVSCFSFHATKVFNSIEGGAVTYRDEAFGETLYKLKNFGIRVDGNVDGVGSNAKMNEFCAAMGICNLRHVDEEIAKRKKVVEHYRSRLEGVEGLQLNPIQEGLESNYAYFPVVFSPEEFGADRDEVMAALGAQNILARKYFYPVTNEFECFDGRFDVSATPIASRISRMVLTVPLYADLTPEDVDRICDIILQCRK